MPKPRRPTIPEPKVHRLDVRGTLCPVPLLMARRAVEGLAAGEQLEVVGDDATMEVDFPRWCEESGNRLLHLDRDGRRIRVVLEVKVADVR